MVAPLQVRLPLLRFIRNAIAILEKKFKYASVKVDMKGCFAPILILFLQSAHLLQNHSVNEALPCTYR